jgi:farnesyl-diphosphate farnesyltransferase
LLEQCESSLRVLESLAPADLALVRRVLDTIVSGQLLDLERFGEASAENLKALDTPEDLDDDTYRVAGCVGEFWTRLCRAHLFPRTPLDDELLLANAVRFGKGLQLVNILRDLPADLRQGRCYLPRRLLAEHDLQPEDLRQHPAAAQVKVQPLYEAHLRMAEEHLAAGWDYTNMLPRGQVRVRLACAWPILIGARTIEKLRRAPILETTAPIKVDRKEVKAIMRRTVLCYPFARAWRRLGPTR